MLTVLDEHTRECPAVVVARSLKADDARETLTEISTQYEPPTRIRSDNGSEFPANSVRDWLRDPGVKTFVHRAGQPFGEWPERALQWVRSRRRVNPCS